MHDAILVRHMSGITIGCAGIAHRLLVFLEDFDDFGGSLALGGDFVPELHGRILHLFPFSFRDAGEF